MDTEDRDHFKTIGAQAAKLASSPTLPAAGNSPLNPSPAYCLDRAKVLFGSYKKDEVNDPTIYCAAIAATLGLYSQSVIDFVTDPRTGIASEIKWPPNVAEVRSFCNSAAARMEVLARPARRVALPFVPPPLKPGEIDSAMHAKLVDDGKTKARAIGPFEQKGDEWNRW